MSKPVISNRPPPTLAPTLDPYAPPPAVNRKVSSGPAVSGPPGAGKAGNKFYDGPTVSAKADELKSKAKVAAKTTAAETKILSKRAAASARQHPWGIVSLITTIPFLIAISLFSTVICPPPGPSSTFSRLVRTPLGLHGEPSTFHETICYPASVYHREVLTPYIYPIIDRAQTRFQTHPLYKATIEPGYNLATESANKVWEGPVKPVVDRIYRAGRKVYLTFVHPHLPYVQTRINALTTPYTTRASALHKQYVSPHIEMAQRYGQAASNNAANTYKYAAGHPLTDTAGRYARLSQKKGYEAYMFSRPHMVRFGKQVERVATEVLGPRIVTGIEVGAKHAAMGIDAFRVRVVQLYYTHLDPHIGSHVTQATKTLAPYTSTFNAKVYQPYLRHVVDAILPATIFAQERPKSFWSLISDIIPSPGTHVSDRQFAGSKVTASVPGKATPSTKGQSFTRSDMDRNRDALKRRIDKKGQEGYEQVKEELLALYRDHVSSASHFPLLRDNAKAEIERDIDYTLKGLDKLYTGSTSLTRDQVKDSGDVADERVQKKVQKIKERLHRKEQEWRDEGKPIVRRAFDEMDKEIRTDVASLQNEMAELNGVTPNDWTKFNSIRKASDAWKDKYAALHKGEIKDRDFTNANANIPMAIKSLETELDDGFEAYRERVGILRRTAYDRIDAREAVNRVTPKSASKSVSSASKVASKSLSSVTEEGKATILPIVEQVAGVAAAANGIIGKGKDQIMDALNQANAAVAGESSVGGYTDQAKASASSAYDAASSAVHDATRSAMSAVGATPSPESLGEYGESILSAGSKTVESIVSAASEALHQGTGSVLSAVGASHTPENAQEHLESIGNVVAQGYATVAGQVGDAIHQGTRSAMTAVGATPSPESVGEYAESIASAASRSVESVVAAASEAIHQGTRSAMSAVGATPSPESAQEHIESVGNVVADGYSSVSSVVADTASDASLSINSAASVVSASASSVVGAASSVLHDGTRAAIRAVGATPSPETPGEYAESLASAASSSASSLASAASSAVHDATRSAMKAVGATPSPETPMEHIESVVDVVSSSASSVYDAAASVAASATDQAVYLASSIQSALGLLTTSTPAPLASSASAYLSSLSANGVSAGADLLASGSSILASLQAEAGYTLHSATRAASKAVGATPSPESMGEYVDSAKEQVREVVGSVGSLAAEVTEAVRRRVDEL